MTVSREFVYGGYVDEVVCRFDAGVLERYFHSNHQYSVTSTSDTSGAIKEYYRYGPYGERSVYNANKVAISEPTEDFVYGYTGRRFDAESGLYYFRARYYSIEMGRFISVDPAGFVDGLSLYLNYFNVNGVDPSGKFAFLLPILLPIAAWVVPRVLIGIGVGIAIKVAKSIFKNADALIDNKGGCDADNVMKSAYWSELGDYGFWGGFIGPVMALPYVGPVVISYLIYQGFDAGIDDFRHGDELSGTFNIGLSLLGFKQLVKHLPKVAPKTQPKQEPKNNKPAKPLSEDAGINEISASIGKSNPEVGDYLGWGKMRMNKQVSDFTKEGLIKEGLTKEVLMAYKKAYQRYLNEGHVNKSAELRVKSLEEILEVHFK